MMSSLPYVLHGTTLALAWFLLFNMASTIVVAVVAGLLLPESRPTSPGLWLSLRLAPAIVSCVFVAAVFLPSYLRFTSA